MKTLKISFIRKVDSPACEWSRYAFLLILSLHSSLPSVGSKIIFGRVIDFFGYRVHYDQLFIFLIRVGYDKRIFLVCILQIFFTLDMIDILCLVYSNFCLKNYLTFINVYLRTLDSIFCVEI